MRFKDINKIGFYANPKDTNREIIFEVFENTDVDWLKKEPEAKLLVDTWYYSHTDTDDIKHYDVSGTLTILCRENPENKIEVEEITDTKYIVKDIVMQEDKLTYKQKYEKYKQCLDEIKEICHNCWNCCDCKKCEYYEDCEGYLSSLILQKIEKVKGKE